MIGRIDAGRLCASYAVLMAAHDLGDHVVQTDHQAATKATSWAGMAGHVGSYTALQVAALVALRAGGVRPTWRRVLAAVAWSAATHALLDRRWPVKRALELTGSRGFARGQMRIPESLVLTERAESIPIRQQGGGSEAFWSCHVGHLQETEVPVPLHGPYLADQALHHGVLAIAAAILAGGSR